jgi:hypothetical protein
VQGTYTVLGLCVGLDVVAVVIVRAKLPSNKGPLGKRR